MDFKLFHIANAPRDIPPWELILGDLGNPTAVQIARTLDVGVSTVFRWNQTNEPPKAARLALFWLTRWGYSLIHTQATNDAMHFANLARALHLERNGLKAHVELLGRQRDRLSHQVAHFAALAQGLEPAAMDLDEAAIGGDLSQVETFRKVLLAPSGESRRQPGRKGVGTGGHCVAYGSAGTTSFNANGAEAHAPGGTGRQVDVPEESIEREPPASADATAVLASDTLPLPNRSAGALKWPGTASAPPLQRPQTASLGDAPQPPKPNATKDAATAPRAVFQALVKASISPAPRTPRKAKRGRSAAPQTTQPTQEVDP